MDQPTFDPTPCANRAAHRVGAGMPRRLAMSAISSARFARWLAGSALCLSAGVLLVTPAASAQDADGPIVIPGPGEKNPAALADLAQQMQAAPAKRAGSPATLAAATAQSMAPGPVSRNTDEFTRAANASGSIVIPGAGEPASAAPQMIRTNFKPDANGVVTIPAANTQAGAAGVNVVPGQRQAVPVVVTPAVRPAVGVQPVMANAPVGSAAGNAGVGIGIGARNALNPNVSASGVAGIASDASANGGFDSLASRGEPPQLGANGKPVAARPIARPVTSAAQFAGATPASNGIATAVPASAIPPVSTAAAAATAATASTLATPARSSPNRPLAPALAQQNLRPAAVPQPAPLPGQQDAEAIRGAALAFLQQQSTGLPGKVDITVAQAFPRGLAACTALEPFMPSGARLWGRTTVGVRCAGERPWTIYLQARISLHATYYLAARAMAPGEVLSAADLVARDGDLTGLPQAIITDPSEAIGSVTLMRVAGGMPLRCDMLKSASAVSIGQTVRVVAAGAGFAISAEGSAMNNASPGQQVKVRTANGQIISGIVKDGSTVEIQL
ncbi:flagellar basal body P-ring formation chaperone FlgA [Paraburkholderia sp. D15]|uniref:flagellar basal body P-ring formation chaperone FlgA n=1 Tax=Paraburkholderia sp. D15 TaxID=2880218 RepID=UPI00247A5327|nr:flagellar basal body P-ring formation chaperone FlgA [Paraburkholderia sp. D15]WGS49771.1 flagellar basal body P-ring formation chaperone FlgA [Paraburkholderia sp. D15]